MSDSARLVSAGAGSDDDAQDSTIRPRLLGDYIGQPAVREQMEIFIEAARNRGEALDHVLIFGPPGLGKTTLAHIVAHEMGVNLRQTSGPVLERPGDLAALLTNLEPRDVLFIDEIHRLSPVVEEILYPAMEDYQLDIMIGEGPAARAISRSARFTLAGATTRAGLLTSPLRDRFGIVQRLEFFRRGPAHIAACRRHPRRNHRQRRRSRTGAAFTRHAVSPIACCAVRATTPRSRPTACSMPRSPRAPRPAERRYARLRRHGSCSCWPSCRN